MSFDKNSWFLNAIRYFRNIGFFSSHNSSDDELGEQIKSYWRGDWEEFLTPVTSSASADQLLLIADTRRVWWHDLEGAYPGANFYLNVLNEWASISRGQFKPEKIEETWKGDDGPAEITFILNGSKHTFVHKSGDFLDHGILKLINDALTNTPYRFEVATDYGDSNWIVMLNRDEKNRLKRERSWNFLW